MSRFFTSTLAQALHGFLTDFLAVPAQHEFTLLAQLSRQPKTPVKICGWKKG